MTDIFEKIPVSIERGGRRLIFGHGVILSKMEAEAVKYDYVSPTYGDGDAEPLPCSRRITLEGYIVPTSGERGVCEIAMARHLLSRIASPLGQLLLRVGDRSAVLTGAGLSFPRSEPFSGERAERFTLSATVLGGYFFGDEVVCTPLPVETGFKFPLMPVGESHVVGNVTGDSVITLTNGGEVSSPFRAELSPGATAVGFFLTDNTTGKHISCSLPLGSGDIVRISTYPEDMYLTLLRGGVEMNLTGRADGSSELFSLTPGEHTLTIGGGVPFTGRLAFCEKFVSW